MLRPERTEVQRLRSCVGSLASRLGMDKHIPGWGYDTTIQLRDLDRVAETEERGWNALVGRIVNYLEEKEVIKY